MSTGLYPDSKERRNDINSILIRHECVGTIPLPPGYRWKSNKKNWSPWFFCLWRVNNHICIDSICKYMATRYTLNHKFPILKHLVMNNISKMFLVASLLIVFIIVKPSLNKMGAWAGLQSPGANQTCFLKSHLKLTSKLQMAAHEHCFLTCEEVYLDESIRAYIDICFWNEILETIKQENISKPKWILLVYCLFGSKHVFCYNTITYT